MNLSQIQIFFKYFSFFFKTEKWKFIVFIIISLTAVFFDGIGLSLFIPLLTTSNVVASSDNALIQSINVFFDAMRMNMNLNNILIMIIVVFTLKAFAVGFQNLLKVYISSSIKRDWKKKIANLCGDLNYKYFIHTNTGFLSNILTKETDSAVGAFSKYCVIIINAINIAAYMLFSFFLSFKITLLAGCAGLLMILIIRKIFNITERLSLKATTLNAILQQDVIQMFHSFKYLKATSNFKKLYNKICDSINSMLKVEVKQYVSELIVMMLLEISAVWMVIGIIFYHVSIQGHNISSILILAMFFHKTIRQINTFPGTWNSFLINSGSLYVVTKTIKELEDNAEISGAEKFTEFKDKIVFKNINFSHGDKQILHNINLTIKKNSTIAFVGESGAGKSTTIDLITGVFKPGSGSILVDNINYSDIDLSSFRKKIGYVTQEIIIYNDTISNNVSLWDSESNKNIVNSNVSESIRKAHCEDFVLASEDSYNTNIGDRGVKLSVGQRQRIAIARELYKNVDILIFDEATSALDSKSEQYIQQSITELKNKMTIILIAHRLSTIKNADYIYVLDKGKVAEEGTYADLYKKDSLFKKMCNLQSLTE
ncbi:MAG: hypothetical protein ACD_79C00647G0002 [uncultured bacterium]|nr:MAG: hypothetical protein ACD_79C00647G0002 [uncultured bacterium]